MRTEGGDVPMEVIADRAKLTRGTLYRNFPHRQAMYEAVFEQDLETLQEKLSAESAADPIAFIRLMAQLMMIYDKFLTSLAHMSDYDAVGNEARMVGLVAAPLAAAQARGAIRPEVEAGDILMACRMLASNWRLDVEPHAAGAFERRLTLMMQGLGGTASSPEPAAKKDRVRRLVRRPVEA